MTNTSPTPSDDSWRIEYAPYTNHDGREIPCFRIYPDDNDEACIAQTNEHLPRDIQERAANLIAAAPALLAAASLVIDRWSHGDLADAVRMLDAAVAEAKGETR
jgi:hypothetical protein